MPFTFRSSYAIDLRPQMRLLRLLRLLRAVKLQQVGISAGDFDAIAWPCSIATSATYGFYSDLMGYEWDVPSGKLTQLLNMAIYS